MTCNNFNAIDARCRHARRCQAKSVHNFLDQGDWQGPRHDVESFIGYGRWCPGNSE